jgi:hypothetical protein
LANNKLKPYVDQLVRTKYGSVSRLAAKIGMSVSAFTRGVQKQGTLSVENCIYLAAETGDELGQILWLAGKPDMAEVCDRLTGKTFKTLSPDAQALVHTFGQLDDEAQDIIVKIAERFAGGKGGWIDSRPATHPYIRRRRDRQGR